MRLHFFRHALATDYDGSIPDHLRPLTSEGILRTRRAARVLKLLNFRLDRLYTSPLIRARQTADIIAPALGIAVQVRQELGPGFNVAAIEKLTHDLSGESEVMFVGHEPDFSDTICALTGGRVQVKKGCLISIDICAYQPLHGEVSLIIPPKMFNRLG